MQLRWHFQVVTTIDVDDEADEQSLRALTTTLADRMYAVLRADPMEGFTIDAVQPDTTPT